MSASFSAEPAPSHVTTAYSGCKWTDVPTQGDRFSVRQAMRELMATREVRHGFPGMAAIIQFLSVGVSQSVLTKPKSSRLIYLMRRIVDSLVTVGYVAIYLDRRTEQLDVVSPYIYLAVTPREYETINGGEKRPAVGRVRSEMRDVLVESHVAFFPNDEEAEEHFHPKFGTPIVFVGDWHPEHGIPTTPCHAAYNSFETRKNIVAAAKVTAARNMQPATGLVMQQQPAGLGATMQAINSVTGAIGPTDVLNAYGQQLSSLHQHARDEMEKTVDELRMRAVDGELADQLSAVITRGGDGHMAWVPPTRISELNVDDALDALLNELGIGYQVPADALNLKSALEKSAHMSMREAHKTCLSISSMANIVQMIIDISTEVALRSTGGKKLHLPEGRLQPVVPPEILLEVNNVLSKDGRKRLFADALRVEEDLIDGDHLKEREWQSMMEMTEVRERAAKRQRTS